MKSNKGDTTMETKLIALACLVRSLKNAFIFVATIALALVLSSKVEAVFVSTQYVNINQGPADFGGSHHSFGGPEGDAVVTFDYDNSSGQVVAKASVRGTLYWDDLFSS